MMTSFATLPLLLAVAAPPQPVTITAFWENDSNYVKPNNETDEHYTAGYMLLIEHEPDWARKLAGDGARGAAGYFAGQQIFTPVDIETAALVPDDRPYAGYLFVGAFWERVKDRTLDHVRFELGVTGDASLAHDAQDWAHDLIDIDKANGWDHQIDSEVTVQFAYQRKWRVTLLDRDGWGIDTIPAVGFNLGTVRRQLEAGNTFRFGWRLPKDFGPTRMDDLAGGPDPRQTGFSAYGFVRLGGRAVQHNAFIDGPDFHSDPGTKVESAPFVGELTAGFALRYQRDAWALSLGYAQVFNTGEFREQSGGDEFATLNVSVVCGF